VPGFVAVFLVIFLYCGFAGEEAWPFTGWRLFSRIRTEQQTSWVVHWSNQQDRLLPFPFDELSFAYAGHMHILSRFPGEGPDEQAAICQAWLEAIRDRDPKELRISRTTWMLSDRDGKRARPPRVEEVYTCDRSGVRPTGSVVSAGG